MNTETLGVVSTGVSDTARIQGVPVCLSVCLSVCIASRGARTWVQYIEDK